MVDPGEFVGGAGLGTAVSMLCAVIIDLIQKNRVFTSHFKGIECTLKDLEKKLKQMCDCNQKLSYTDANELKGLEKVLRDGNNLVETCIKIRKWNVVRKYRYEYKLIRWEEDLQKQIGQVLALQGILGGKMTAVEVIAVGAKVENVTNEVKNLKDSTGKIEVSTGNIEVSTKKIEVTTQKLDATVDNLTEEVNNTKVSIGNIEVSTGNIEVSTKKIEVTTQKLDATVDNLTEEVNNVKVSIGNIGVSTGKIEVSTGNVEVSTKKIEVMVENLSKKMEVNQMVDDVFKPWCEVPELPSHPVGLDGPLKELKEKLLKDGLSKLVLTGPGGCGKSTLASKFCRDKEVKDIFKDNIIFFTISKDPKMDLIVQQLYQGKGKKVPAFTNAATLVPTFMREQGKSPLLLVLDEVWSGSESLLQMFDLEMTDYKVLVTSTSQFEGFGSAFEVKLLGDKDAMELFGHYASLGDKSSHISEKVATKIVDKCEGYPVALKMIGESLSGKPECVWWTRLSQWSTGFSSIFKTKNQLLRCLQSSIDELDEVTRRCFLDFALFPQSKYIPVATLFDMWAELYGLRGDHEFITKLYELSSRSLAKFVHGREVKMEANGYYSQHFVIQLGVLRELAIYISKQDKKEKDRKRLIIEISKEDYPKWWTKQKTMEARLLSISTDEMFSMEWPIIQLPKAKVLVLFFQTQDYVLPKFVDKMPELKVLVITCDRDYEFGAALESWIHPQNQLSNLKTIILEGISIPSITKNELLLESVKKISMSRCYEVTKAFSDHSIQISGFFPNLEVMNIDFCDLMELPSDLGSLTHLRELNITNCCGLSTLPEGMENLVNLEVLRLRFCRDFSKFQHSIKLQRLRTIDLAYCSSINELPKDIGDVSSLRELNTRHCPALNELPRSMSDLKHLEVVICSSKTKLLTECLPYGKNIPMDAPTLGWDDFN